MSAYLILDVEIHDQEKYQEYMAHVKPVIERAGAKYLARGGEHKVYEGDWQPYRIVILEFPTLDQWEKFYVSDEYKALKNLRESSSTGRLVSVMGVDHAS